MGSDSSTWHRLTEKNLDDRTAVCSVCGPTEIYVTTRSDNRARASRVMCMTKKKHFNSVDKYKVKGRTTYALNRGMTIETSYDEELEQRWTAQDGKCAICSSELVKGKYGFALDHDHETGRIRSVLCNKCNLGLGMFHDDADLIFSAWTYLAKHSEELVV